MSTYHRHLLPVRAVGGRLGKHDKPPVCERFEEPQASSIATPEARAALWELAARDPAKFISFCRDVQVCDLDQIPGWPDFVEQHDLAAAVIVRLARRADIRAVMPH